MQLRDDYNSFLPICLLVYPFMCTFPQPTFFGTTKVLVRMCGSHSGCPSSVWILELVNAQIKHRYVEGPKIPQLTQPKECFDEGIVFPDFPHPAIVKTLL